MRKRRTVATVRSLAALTANDPAFQPGFEQVDTRIDAAVPFYGAYDLLDRDALRKGKAEMRDFLEQTQPGRKRRRRDRSSNVLARL